MPQSPRSLQKGFFWAYAILAIGGVHRSDLEKGDLFSKKCLFLGSLARPLHFLRSGSRYQRGKFRKKTAAGISLIVRHLPSHEKCGTRLVVRSALFHLRILR